MKDIRIDFTDCSRPMRPMHAVNNGPVGNSVHQIGNFAEYKALEIPYARNHDASFCEYYGGEYTVDVHRIFRDFDADETLEQNYDFEMTDRCVLNTVAAGTQVFYRLGAHIEHTKKYGTYPPKDFQKWARICEHIILHYNEGWAQGHTLNIQYWEIWNEPDCHNMDGSNPCWQGTDDQFVDFFITALRHLKGCFPNLKIGGPAFTVPVPNNRFGEKLLGAVKEAGLPLDFYSFHTYCNDPRIFRKQAEDARRLLDSFGFLKTETILNEWNYVTGWDPIQLGKSGAAVRGIKGAAFTAASMCVAQDSSLDMFMYYDARPSTWNGIFNMVDHHPMKTYNALMMFSTLYKLGHQAKAESGAEDVYCCAASDGKSAAVMCVRFKDVDDAEEPVTVRVAMHSLPTGVPMRAEYLLMDESHDLSPVREEIFTAADCASYLTLDLFAGYLIRFTPLEA